MTTLESSRIWSRACSRSLCSVLLSAYVWRWRSDQGLSPIRDAGAPRCGLLRVVPAHRWVRNVRALWLRTGGRDEQVFTCRPPP